MQQQIHVDKYERYWLNAVIVVLGIFFASLIVGAVVYGAHPTVEGGTLNILKLDESEFASPGVRHMGGNQYEVRMVAQTWSFVPAEIRLPAGADVTFLVTSRDVTHGLMIEDTLINLQIVPGHTSEARAVFEEPGEYVFQCHEYCGRNHHAMHGVIIVEEETTATDGE